MTNKETKYAEKLMKFIIGEEVKVKRTKGEKVKLKELGVGHLSSDKSQSVKLGEREYASGTISKIEKDSAWNFPPAEGRKGAWPLKPNPDKPQSGLRIKPLELKDPHNVRGGLEIGVYEGASLLAAFLSKNDAEHYLQLMELESKSHQDHPEWHRKNF